MIQFNALFLSSFPSLYLSQHTSSLSLLPLFQTHRRFSAFPFLFTCPARASLFYYFLLLYLLQLLALSPSLSLPTGATMSSMPSPPSPPLLVDVIGGETAERSHSPSSGGDSIKPSVVIIVLILSVTVIVSVSLCLLLRHLNRRCLRHLTRSSTSATAAASSRRVSPEDSPTSSLLHSLPLFTFSSITRRSSSAASSAISGDCAVCLSKFELQDQLRLLPLCCHAFHVECIDTWLSTNQTCPLCRSPIFASDADLMKVLQASTNDARALGDSFRLEIGSISRRQAASDSGDQRASYSVGSFDYIIDDESEITMDQTHRRRTSDKEEVEGAEPVAPEASLAAEVAVNRSWLKEYVDRLSFSLSSRALSFRSSGRFFTGSSRRSDIPAGGEWDVEANRIGEEISELFRWISGV